MAPWQKRARIGVAAFGVVFAGIVYSAIRERDPAAPPEPVRRVDPKAIAETYSAVLNQLTRSERTYEVTAERLQQYSDGSSRLFGVRVAVPNRGGRDFVITAKEAYAANGRAELQLTGDVKVSASDGFELTTGEATFDQNTGIARAKGAVAFRKGRMSGSGVGMMYDQPNDVLRFDASSRVIATDEEGDTAIDFSAGVSTLDRVGNVLTLERTVHVLRGEEVIDSDSAVARLTESDEIVTYLELRGNSRVTGGTSGFESMSARDIDLDYTDDGETLERVVLGGQAAIAMTGAGGAPGRHMSGERLDLRLASDGSLTGVTGQGSVELLLPATAGGSARRIQSGTLDASGEPGKGLTAATFTSPGCGVGDARARCVVYREEAGEGNRESGAPAPGREARSRRLLVTLVDDAVTTAAFDGTVSFQEQGLTASGAAAVYTPDKGTLRLTGSDAGGGPRVDDEQATIEGETIDLALEGRRMTANGDVRTILRGKGTGSSRPQQEGGQPAPKMPRLLRDNETVHISAAALEYQGSGGMAVYTGSALLSQGTATTIRGRIIRLDRQTGDLVATEEATSRLVLDDGNSVGRAHEIRYEDARRMITYSAAPVGPTNGRGAASAATDIRVEAGRVRLNIPDGDVTAQRIEVVLAAEGSTVERLEAYSDVSVTTGSRTATGARLTFHAKEGRYVMESAPGVPMRIIDRSSNSCNETTGSTLIFFKGTDRMTVDGQEAMRTRTKGGGACGPEPLSR